MDINNKSLLEMNNDEIFNLLQTKLSDNEIIGTPIKTYNCPHEIVFTVTANVFTSNEKGEIIDTEEICTKNYHIPVAIDKDYAVFMQTFFEHIEKCIISGIQKEGYNNE